VLKISNLRIADAGVFPSAISGDLSPTGVMLAEKATNIRGREAVKFYRQKSDRALGLHTVYMHTLYSVTHKFLCNYIVYKLKTDVCEC